MNILFPLLLLAGGGYLLTLLFSLSEETLIRIVTDFFMPALVFYSLYTSEIELSKTIRIVLAVTFILIVLLVISLLYCRLFGVDFRSFSLPVLFMNSGFLGIPLMKLWGGFAAMNVIVIFDQIQTFYIFTVGILIITGGFSIAGLREMIRSPLLWSIVAGFSFRYLNIPVFPPLLEGLNYIGSVAPALAMFALGCSLQKRAVEANPHLVAGLLFRFVFGFLAGWMITSWLDITGMERTVILVASALPSAVFSVVLPLRYGVETRFAGSLVLLSTVLSLFSIPILFFVSQ